MTTTTWAQSRAHGGGGGTLLTAALIGGTTLLAFAGVGAPLRLVFPLASFLLAAYFLATDRREALVELLIWLFMVTPGIRRVVDNSAGWDVVNVLMLAPYTASVVCVLPALRGLFGRRFPYSFPFALLLACVAYALVLALVDGRVFGGLYDSLRWAVPPCVGLMIASDVDRRERYRDAAVRALLLGLLWMSAYGLYQFVFVPAWDAFWMRNVEMNSIGTPEPFLLRVFSTMNSPGSFATFGMMAMMVVLPARGLLRWPALALTAAALLLTMVRAVWLGSVLGFAFLLLAGRGWRVRGTILGAGLALGLALPIVAQIPEAGVLLNDRLQSLTSLAGDTSASERSDGYSDFFNYRLAKYPFGIGLAVNGTYASYLDQGEATIIDGAVIEIGTAMGVIGGVLYLAAIVAVVLICARAGLNAADPFTSGCAAAVFCGTLLLTSGTITVGENGFLFWVAAGFCMAAVQETRRIRPRL